MTIQKKRRDGKPYARENNTSLSVKKETKIKVDEAMHKYKIKPFDRFMNAILRILKDFKPELEERKND